MTFYLDSSAWVKRYCHETGSPWVRRLFTQQPRLACSTLGLVEVTATLSRKRKSGGIDTPVYAESMRQLESDWQGIMKISLSQHVVDHSTDIARDQALRSVAAIHLASALTLKQRLSVTDRLVMVTSDRELKEAGQAAGMEVADPGDPSHTSPIDSLDRFSDDLMEERQQPPQQDRDAS